MDTRSDAIYITPNLFFRKPSHNATSKGSRAVTVPQSSQHAAGAELPAGTELHPFTFCLMPEPHCTVQLLVDSSCVSVTASFVKYSKEDTVQPKRNQKSVPD